MGREADGFTLIELMIVIAIIAIIAAIAVPSLMSARMIANETAAIETLRSIATAQHQFRQSAKADEDRDSCGEYGTIGELSGAVGVRGGLSKVPTDLTASMRHVSLAGEVTKSGYVFRMYLPDFDGHGVHDNPGGGIGPGVVDPKLAASIFACYAWPANYGVSGRRTFFVGRLGEIHCTDSKAYSGQACSALHAGAAFLTSDADSITGRAAVGTTASDGNFWTALD